jgi:acyl-CoA synthetase (AMP-forming)/AMP-acid ligase II
VPHAATLVDCLVRAATIPGEGLRVLDRRGEETWLSWTAVLERSSRVAGGIANLGVRPGERVALVFPSTPGFFDAFFGVLLAGAVPTPLYPPVRLGRLAEFHAKTARMISVAGARLVLADAGVRRLLGETARLARPALGCRTLDELEAGEMPATRVREDDLGLVQFSSGTTREPKGVALSHRALVAQAEMLNSFWPETDGIRHTGVSWLPLYHDMGLIGAVFTALERPGTLTVLPPEVFVARPAAWLQAISRYRATISPAPNFAYSLCVQRIRDEEMEGLDLSSWRIALNGAEQAVPGVMRAFSARFGRWGFRPSALTPVYGLSEAALAVTFSEVDRPFVAARFDRDLLAGAGIARESAEGREIASVGRPVPGVEVRVIGPGGEPVPEASVGTIECLSPSLMDGYLGQPQETREALRGGWLNTGDLGFLWKGDLFVTGRAKDLLVLRGRKYAPEEVETAVETVPGIRAGCVVAATWLSEGAGTERLVVLAEARRDVQPQRYGELASAASNAVVGGPGLVADCVEILPPGTLPRTSSGKLRRQEALRLFLAGQLAPPDAVTPLRLAVAVARSSVAYLLNRLRRQTGTKPVVR